MLPNLLIPGPGKTGTSFLAFAVSQHPEICMVPEKEVHFFEKFTGDETFQEFVSQRIVGYEFQVSIVFGGQRYLLDAPPSNFNSFCGPENIAMVLGPETRCLFVIRNPAERAFSDYVHQVVALRLAKTFHSVLESENLLPKHYSVNGRLKLERHN